MSEPQRHGAAYAAAAFSPDAVAASLGRNDGGFGRAQQSYYDLPLLHKAHWRWEIVGYFWVGGLAAGSATLAATADTWGGRADAALVRTGRYAAFLGSVASGALLVKDLGRPERFLNMLRIVKFGSPMSVGAWSLTLFSSAAGMALFEQLHRDGAVPFNPGWFIPKAVRNGALALGAGLMSAYTGVLLSATAIPVWYRGRRFIPAVFVASALTTACAFNAAALALTRAPAATLAKVEKLETIAGACELGLLLAYERVVGRDAAAFFGGSTGRNVKTWTMLAGLALPLALNMPAWFSKKPTRGERTHGAPLKTLASAALALYGGYVLRRSFIEAGRLSADDPKPVLERSRSAGC